MTDIIETIREDLEQYDIKDYEQCGDLLDMCTRLLIKVDQLKADDEVKSKAFRNMWEVYKQLNKKNNLLTQQVQILAQIEDLRTYLEDTEEYDHLASEISRQQAEDRIKSLKKELEEIPDDS